MKIDYEQNGFIKSPRFLRKHTNKLQLSLAEISIIEFILSYQNTNQDCRATNEMIAEYICSTEGYVKNVINKLAIRNLIIRDTESNRGKGYGGKTRYLTVNTELIDSIIEQEEPEAPIIDEPKPEVRTTIETKEDIVFPAKEEGEDLYPDELFIKVEKPSKVVEAPDKIKMMVTELRDIIFTGRMSQDDLAEARNRVSEPEKYDPTEFEEYYDKVFSRYRKSFA